MKGIFRVGRLSFYGFGSDGRFFQPLVALSSGLVQCFLFSACIADPQGVKQSTLRLEVVNGKQLFGVGFVVLCMLPGRSVNHRTIPASGRGAAEC